eukprot:2948528-Rhodomonas_salina.1
MRFQRMQTRMPMTMTMMRIKARMRTVASSEKDAITGSCTSARITESGQDRPSPVGSGAVGSSPCPCDTTCAGLPRQPVEFACAQSRARTLRLLPSGSSPEVGACGHEQEHRPAALRDHRPSVVVLESV